MLAVKLLSWLKAGPKWSRVPGMQVLPMGVPVGHGVVYALAGAATPGARVYIWFSPSRPQVGVAPSWLSCRQSAKSPGLASYCEISLCPCVPTYARVRTVDLLSSL